MEGMWGMAGLQSEPATGKTDTHCPEKAPAPKEPTVQWGDRPPTILKWCENHSTEGGPGF